MNMKKLKISIYLSTFTLVLSQNTLNNDTVDNDTTPSSQDASSTPSNEIICNGIDKCRNVIPPEYDNLKTRKCMCDEKCELYNDCCKDSERYNQSSQHYDQIFSCFKTLFDGYIYMVNKCPSNYKDREIIKNCQTADEGELVSDVFLSIPVGSRTKNITYRNVFCAFCNNETEYDFWDVVLQYEEIRRNVDVVLINSSSDNTNYSTNEIDSILSNLMVDKNGKTLISHTASSTYKCNVQVNLPSKLASSVRSCRPNSNDRKCSICDQSNNSCVNVTEPVGKIFLVSLKDKHLPKTNHCDHVPDNADKELFCASPKEESVATDANDDIESCFFQSPKGELCLINSFFKEKTEFYYVDNETIFSYKYKAKFGKEEWTGETSEKGSIYVCGTEIPQSQAEKMYSEINNVLTEVLIKFSIIFLIVYLVISANKKHLQSLPNKIIFSYCLTLLAVYTVFEVTQLLPTCYVAAAITHYLFLSCFMWLLIASYDFWQVICRSSNKLQTLAGKARLKRYIVYCVLGWISPLSIMAVSIYFELALNKTVSCPWKPGYGRLKQCFIAQSRPANYFFYYPTTATFCIIILLFAHTSYHIYLSKRKNIKSTAQNNYYMLFAKLALTMGLTWTLGMLVTYTNVLFFRVIYVILNSSQGTFMFFAYGFKKTMIRKVYNKEKDSATSQPTKSTAFITISDRVKGRPSQSSTTDHSTTQESQN